MKPIKITLLPQKDARRIAEDIVEAGGGETNDCEVLEWITTIAEDRGLELDAVRHETRASGARQEVHFDLREMKIVVQQGIEVRPAPDFVMPAEAEA